MRTMGHYMGVQVQVLADLPSSTLMLGEPDETSGIGRTGPYGMLYRFDRDLYVNHHGFISHYRAGTVEEAEQVMRHHRRCVYTSN